MEPCRPKLGKHLHLPLDKKNHPLIWRASNTDRDEVRQTSNGPIRVWGPIRKWAPMQCGLDATKPVHYNASISVRSWRIEIANPEIRHIASTEWLRHYTPSLVLCWLKLDQYSTRGVPVACSCKFRKCWIDPVEDIGDVKWRWCMETECE